nr:unnamed protein product [Callosobruchus chinensis]
MSIISYLNIDIVHLIQAMESKKYHPRSPTEDAFVRGWKTLAWRCQTFFILINAFLLGTVIVLAVYNGEKTLFVAHVPSFINWKVFFGSQILMSLYTSQMAGNYASMLIAFLVELVIQIYFMKEAMEKMRDQDEFRECVQWHLLLILLRKKIQRFCSIGMTIVFLMSVIIICTTVSLLTQKQDAEVAFFFAYLSEVVLIILVNCWCGSEVINQSDEISFSIYSSDWAGRDISYKKLIKMQLLFTKKPMQIFLGGGITAISLPVFVTIMKTAYTVFTILQRFQD